MKCIKTYGMYGLLEWHGTLSVGGVSMKASFTNGSATAYGVSPATLITKDELTQFVIEHCEKFKNGKIKLITAKPILGTETDKQNAPVAKVAETQKQEDAAPVHTEQSENGEQVITVNSKSEAVEYLKEHFPAKGYTSVKLRTKEGFEAACKECGVRFVW